MTQEEKELLLKELCTRLPYGVKVKANLFNDGEVEFVGTLKTINLEKDWFEFENIMTPCHLEELKPFLRPMSSMTEKEKFEQKSKMHYEGYFVNPIYFHTIEEFDYLNSIHVDYRGLIPMGLALKAPEGIYD